MFDDLKAYFIENVLVLYKDYIKTRKSLKLASSNDLRTAINLSTALYHLREHIPKEIRKNRQEYLNICPDYNLLGNVVNASKHKTLDRNNPQILSAEDIYEVVVCTEYLDLLGTYQHIEKKVFTKLNDETERDLHEIIISVLNMWIKELNEVNILNNFKFKNQKSKRNPRRNTNSGTLNIQVMQYLRFGAKLRIQRYNYEKKIIEPIDLSGVGVRMRIYKPIYTYTLTATKDNKEINIDVDIDENELKQVNKLKTEEEKIDFIIEKARQQDLVK